MTVSSRRRSSRRLLPLLLVLLLAGGGGWWWFNRQPSTNPAAEAGHDGPPADTSPQLQRVGSALPAPAAGESSANASRPSPAPATREAPRSAAASAASSATIRTPVLASPAAPAASTPERSAGQTIPPPAAPSAPAPLAGSPTPAASTLPASASTPPAPTSPAAPAPGFPAGSDLQAALGLLEQGQTVPARKQLSRLLLTGSLTPDQAQDVRRRLTEANDRLIFSKAVTAGDPLVAVHEVRPGQYLGRDIAPLYQVPYEFLEQINATSASRLQVGQKLKVVRGPFHAVVTKGEFRLDLYLTDDQGDLIYVRSFTVGLGEDGSTPVGAWRIKNRLPNPGWTNPRTHQPYDRNDPANPIGEYWLGLEGTDPATSELSGYGIHGTIDPDSIGQQRSMGCVRLGDQDIEQLYKMLLPGRSTVVVKP